MDAKFVRVCTKRELSWTEKGGEKCERYNFRKRRKAQDESSLKHWATKIAPVRTTVIQQFRIRVLVLLLTSVEIVFVIVRVLS